jgi:hypothetical protein
MAPPPAKPTAPKLQDRPHVERGDEIYFRDSKGAPWTGSVICHGEHGCTVKLSGGKQHKVRWEGVLGHRRRTQPSLSIVDQGEDGFVAKNNGSGELRYIHDPLSEDDGEDEPMAKALPPANALERLMALRAQVESPLEKALRKNAPGLMLKPVTDKAGHQTKRWVKSAPDAPKERPQAKPEAAAAAGPPPGHHDAKAGDTVHFEAGEFKGSGKIRAVGAKGATVVDGKGRDHKVTWDEVNARTPPKPGPKLVLPGKGEEKPAPARKPREDGEVDKAYAKRVVDHEPSPEHLPEDHDSYFKTKGSVKMDVANLKSAKSDEENAQGGENGPKRMRAAAEGRLGKRDPIKVTPNADGKTHTVVDGNGTLASVKKYGWKAIPTMVVQPHETQDEVYQGAQAATEYLKDWLNKGSGICDQWGFETQKRAPEDVSEQEYAKPGGMLFIAPTKGLTRATEKVMNDYGGDWSRLKDAARCTIAVDTIAQVQDVVAKLRADGMIVAQPAKDRYTDGPTKVGYRDVNMIIRAPNGHLTEVQVNTKAMMTAKNIGHDDYEVSRTLEGKYGEDTPFEEWNATDQAAYRRSEGKQIQLYEGAYAKLK